VTSLLFFASPGLLGISVALFCDEVEPVRWVQAARVAKALIKVAG